MNTRGTVTSIGSAYWLLAGVLLGFGILAMFSIGIPIFLLGLVMALYRVRYEGGRGFGLILVSMGLVPALYLLYRNATNDASMTFDPDNFWKGIFVYLAVAAGGAVWAAVDAQRTNARLHRK